MKERSCILGKDNLLSKNDFGIDFIKVTSDLYKGDGKHFIYINGEINTQEWDIPIYRYMSFEHLIMMFNSKVLFIPNRQRFSDLRERGENYKKTLEESLHTLTPLPPNGWKKYMYNRKNRWSQIWKQTALCWTYDNHIKIGENVLDENYMMWQCHKSKPYVCRIRASIKRLLNSIRELNNDIFISKIEYVPIMRYRTENDPSDIFKKPEEYSGEQELRIVALHNSIRQCMSSFDIKVPIQPEKLIDEITLSPYICSEEESILKNRLSRIYNEELIKPSMLIEY